MKHVCVCMVGGGYLQGTDKCLGWNQMKCDSTQEFFEPGFLKNNGHMMQIIQENDKGILRKKER